MYSVTSRPAARSSQWANTPSMSAGFKPASRIACRAASHCSDRAVSPAWALPMPASPTPTMAWRPLSAFGSMSVPSGALCVDGELGAYILLQDLADRTARQRRPELDLLGRLQAAESRAAHRDDLVGRGAAARLEFDHGGQALAPVGVGHADHYTVLNRGVSPDD